jgi:hypothetical protein
MHMFFREYPGWSLSDYERCPQRYLDGLMTVPAIKRSIAAQNRTMAAVTAEAIARPATWG